MRRLLPEHETIVGVLVGAGVGTVGDHLMLGQATWSCTHRGLVSVRHRVRLSAVKEKGDAHTETAS